MSLLNLHDQGERLPVRPFQGDQSMSHPSTSITEALDRIRDAMESMKSGIAGVTGQGGQPAGQTGKEPIQLSTFKELEKTDV